MKIFSVLIILTILMLSILMATPVYAAPSGSVDMEVENVIFMGETKSVEVTFQNTASAGITDVASTIQYITISAADLNPARTLINVTAQWEIWSPGDPAARASGSVVSPAPEAGIYAPYSLTETVYLYTWELGAPADSLEAYTDSTQFDDDNTLKILRPGETLKLTIQEECLGLAGDARLWFFFRATEYVPGVIPIVDINSISLEYRMNLYYSKQPGPNNTRYWWPLHNSYDPYDSDLNSGHNFSQTSWGRTATLHAFAKANKLVHQKPPEDPPEVYSIHICGIKFLDKNRDGEYNAGLEPGINEVVITLLGPTGGLAEDEYPALEIVPNEHNPMMTGENELHGSYCFNYTTTEAGTYTFYIREEVPADMDPSTPDIIGPIDIIVGGEGEHDSLNNHFGNMYKNNEDEPSPGPVTGEDVTVGIEVHTIDKAGLIMPLVGAIAVVLLVSSGIILVIQKARRHGGRN